MIELTPDARSRFDEYLQRTRRALQGTRAVEPSEVEQNVIEHVELALAGVPSPVGQEPLRAVLEQLGPPERWLPEDEQPWWRRTLGRLMHGPNDWRLAYLSFAVTVAMVVFFPVGGVLLLPIAFLISRAYVQLMQERGEPVGARAWLVMPPIVLLFLLFAGGALFLGFGFPGVFASEQGMETLGFRDPVGRAERLRMFTGFVMLCGGSWWVLLSGVFALAFSPIRWFFAPVLANVRRGQLLWLTGTGAIVAAAGAALLWLWWA
jgi:hypothetical protein